MNRVSRTSRWSVPSLFRVEVMDHARLRVRGQRRWIVWRESLTRLEAEDVLRFVRSRALAARLVREVSGEVIDGDGAEEQPLVRIGPGGEYVSEIRG